MSDHSRRRLELARRYIEPYAERASIAVLGGSVAQIVLFGEEAYERIGARAVWSLPAVRGA